VIRFEDISAEVNRRLVEQKRRNGWVDPMTRDPIPQSGSGSGYDEFGTGRKVVARKRRAADEDLVEEEREDAERSGEGMGEGRARGEGFKVSGRKIRRVRGEFVEEEL